MRPQTSFEDLPRELRQRVADRLPTGSCDRLMFACSSKDGLSLVSKTTPEKPIMLTAMSTISTVSQVRKRCAVAREA